MRSWRSGSAAVALATLMLARWTTSTPQTQKPDTAKKAAAHRANELTLAGLRPGRDTSARLFRLYPSYQDSPATRDGQITMEDSCHHERLTLDVDSGKNVQVIRVGRLDDSNLTHCDPTPPPSRWRTGLGLRILDKAQSVIQLYGEPDSRSPSTKGGQPLELWYYAFDWAGADVPQVMEVLCTKDKDGQPGRVVEITLAAPSL